MAAEGVPVIQRITMEDVAREAGFSRALVSRALLGRPGVGSEARKTILAAAESLGYRHNAIASRLASRTTNTIGLFLLDIYNEVFADIYSGLREPAERADVDVVLSVGTPDGSSDAKRIDSLLNMRVEAAVLAGCMLPDDEVSAIARSVPLVSATRLIPGVSSVAADERLGGRLAAEHVLELGHRAVAFVGPEFHTAYAERERGYLDAMQRAGLSPRVIRSDLTHQNATRTAAGFLSATDRPTAVVTYNDMVAFAVLEAAGQLGIDVPAQLSVVGYDDTRAAGFARMSLTSMNHQALRLGELSLELALQARGRDDDTVVHTLLNPSLVVRATTGPLV